jgi:hypothetical protein
MQMESLCVRGVDYFLTQKKNLRFTGTGMSKKGLGNVQDVQQHSRGGSSMWYTWRYVRDSSIKVGAAACVVFHQTPFFILLLAVRLHNTCCNVTNCELH